MRRVVVLLEQVEQEALRHELSEPYGQEIRGGIFEKLRAALDGIGDGAAEAALGASPEKQAKLGNIAHRADVRRAAYEEILDHFTQQPVGVGAGVPEPQGPERVSSPDHTTSADSDGRCQRLASHLEASARRAGGTAGRTRMEDALLLREALGELPVSADSDGNQQPLGGDDAAQVSNAAPSIAERGGSGQGSGSALEQLLGWVEEHRRSASVIESWLTPRAAFKEVADEIRRLLTQHPSGGQEADLSRWEDAEEFKAILWGCEGCNALYVQNEADDSASGEFPMFCHDCEREMRNLGYAAELLRSNVPPSVGGQEGGVEEGCPVCHDTKTIPDPDQASKTTISVLACPNCQKTEAPGTPFKIGMGGA
jgi:hypothetical protein